MDEVWEFGLWALVVFGIACFVIGITLTRSEASGQGLVLAGLAWVVLRWRARFARVERELEDVRRKVEELARQRQDG